MGPLCPFALGAPGARAPKGLRLSTIDSPNCVYAVKKSVVCHLEKSARIGGNRVDSIQVAAAILYLQSQTVVRSRPLPGPRRLSWGPRGPRKLKTCSVVAGLSRLVWPYRQYSQPLSGHLESLSQPFVVLPGMSPIRGHPPYPPNCHLVGMASKQNRNSHVNRYRPHEAEGNSSGAASTGAEGNSSGAANVSAKGSIPLGPV